MQNKMRTPCRNPVGRHRLIPLGILVLLVSSTLLATQSDQSTSTTTQLSSYVSRNPVLTPGDKLVIRDDDLGKQRTYRASMDSRGKVTELYTEDGQIKPIDNAVRSWLANVETREPPAPPEPSTAPFPPPELADSVEFKTLMAAVCGDSNLNAHLGSPIVADTDSFHGNFKSWDKGHFNLLGKEFHVPGWGDAVGANADFELNVNGPKGRAMIKVVAHTKSGIWQLSSLEFTADKLR